MAGLLGDLVSRQYQGLLGAAQKVRGNVHNGLLQIKESPTAFVQSALDDVFPTQSELTNSTNKLIGKTYDPLLAEASNNKMMNIGLLGMTAMGKPALIKKGSDVRPLAENLADQFRKKGFEVELQHSGSAAGPSSYLRIYDPQTGRFIVDPIRVSNHSKGAFNTTLNHNILSDDDIARVLKIADDMRAQGPSEVFLKQQAAAASTKAQSATFQSQYMQEFKDLGLSMTDGATNKAIAERLATESGIGLNRFRKDFKLGSDWLPKLPADWK